MGTDRAANAVMSGLDPAISIGCLLNGLRLSQSGVRLDGRPRPSHDRAGETMTSALGIAVPQN